ncbi:DUF6894 family protein [Agrobacterium larrymoorei]|uniref:DUF6894 domain-containing protein n=1 Tax=Agrobacterium larrymoorei TaxID=160699 RepID=A0A4D7E1F1_9HYPH|nr:hypothetical protein [Agrobacterium larrymoorei]QCJ00163.1 hypothetical protein CFBP5473_19740 [Agrobacterium larrymoorei]QYA09394.1 hypothetical protein J5285_18615 [Agrobacterium larrymoorei]
MPKYYFNVLTRDGRVEDPEGSDLPGLEEAYNSAIEDARALMSEAVLEGKDISSRNIEICDEKHSPVQIVPFRDALKVID